MLETIEVKTVVLKVVMHCEGCASSVKRAVARVPGVTSYKIDFPAQKVTVVGDVKPDEVLRRVAKTGKHATFWPEEPPKEEEKKEEGKKEKQEEPEAKADDNTNKEGTKEKANEEDKKEEEVEKPKPEGDEKKEEEVPKEMTKEGAGAAKKAEEDKEEKNPEKNEEKVEDKKNDEEEEKKPEAPKEDPHPITVMLRVAMHCEACVDTVRRAVVRIPGVISSMVDFMAQKVTVVGNVTPKEVFKRVSKTGKQTTFWPEEPKEEKEEKKEEEEEETKEKNKEEPKKEESKEDKEEEAAAAAAITTTGENKDKATTQAEERKPETFFVLEELYPVSFTLRPDYTRYYYY